MDRTVATGTGYIGQYRPAVAKVYESLETCPDDLLLFLHHVPYTHKLHSGKTVIQYIYDSHYEGAEAVEGTSRQWKALKGRVDEQPLSGSAGATGISGRAGDRLARRGEQLVPQASGIADAKGRVGKHPGRFEAESMTSRAMRRDITPWEAASAASPSRAPRDVLGGHAVRRHGRLAHAARPILRPEHRRGALSRLGRQQVIDEWTAADRFPARKMDASASTRRRSPA